MACHIKRGKPPFDSFFTERAKTSIAFKPVDDRLMSEIILDWFWHIFKSTFQKMKCNYSEALLLWIKTGIFPGDMKQWQY